jgi:flap endonuclease-1
MGIKGLNRYLRTFCQNHIKEISLNELKYKTLVIDTSIYMYRFKCDNTLIEGIYQMILQFKQYNITPIFIFDGKPPDEKKHTLQERQTLRRENLTKYYETKDKLENCKNNDDLIILKDKVRILRKNTVRVTKSDVDNVKKLLSLSGIIYYNCEGESDSVCSYMVQTEKAYACLSEDTDMFVYGTYRVLRYFSLIKSSVVIYDIAGMLSELNLTIDEFKNICIYTGSDYNKKNVNDFATSLNIFIMFNIIHNKETTYLKWMIENKYIDDENEFIKAVNMFDISKINLSTNNFIKGQENLLELKQFLCNYGFIFVETINK